MWVQLLDQSLAADNIISVSVIMSLLKLLKTLLFFVRMAFYTLHSQASFEPHHDSVICGKSLSLTVLIL